MSTIFNHFFQCLRWFRKYKVLFLLNIILNLIATIIHLIEPYIYASIISYLFNREWKNIKYSFYIMIICFILKTSINYISSRIEVRVRKEVAYQVKICLMQMIVEISPKMLNIYDDGKLFSIMINDSLLICNYAYSISSYLTDIITIILIGIIIFSTNFILALIVIMVFPFIYIINKKYGKRLNKESVEIYKKTDFVIGLIKNVITNLNDIKINNVSDTILSKFNNGLEDTITRTIYRDNIQLMSTVITSVINFIGNFIFLVFGSILVLKDKLFPGTFVAFSSYAKMFNNSLYSLSTLYSRFQQELIGIDRIIEIDSIYQSFIKDESQKIIPESSPSIISFVNISLEINKKNVLNNISLEIHQNQSLALAGSNGSGKTSILNIMAGIYTPSHGSVLLDKIKMDNLSYSWIQKNIGYVKQLPVIYPVTIRENMLLSNEISVEKLNEVCRDVQIYDDIITMPNGFETVIGEQYNLSAGQQKKVQLARVILKNTPIILLDEPLSNLDISFIKNYENIYNKYFKKKIIIVATHEHDTLYLYNDVLSISNGRKITYTV